MRAMGLKTILLGAVLVTGHFSYAQAGSGRDVVKLTNEFRTSNNLPALRLSPLLESIAATHGSDMRHHGFFSHMGTDGTSVADRALRQGYNYCLIAENIAVGQRSAKRVTKDWIKSRGHRENLLNIGVTEIGVIQEGNYWVMVLGRRC
ncbi:CAP domain-containing protein [Cognatishimia sp. D5M38]|uniref:CAP domain-containing protein n=1 Tax=Cognatishimia coralii TaxID=3083254 RepID=A0ABU8QBB7_9RHOB